MSSVKISQLNLITQLNANTQNTLFVAVDVPSGITGKFTGHTLAQGLYSNEILNVGNNLVTLPNTIAQFSLAGGSYIQTNLFNLDNGGTADIVVTANTGTDSTYFIDMGYANANVTPGLEFNNLGTALYPLDGYIYAQGNGVGNARANGGNLIVGTTSTGTGVKFIAGGYDSGNIVATITADGFKLVNGRPMYFTDGTTQNTAAASFAYSNVIYGVANVGPIAFTQSNASFLQANAAYAMALAGIGTANSATTLANAAFSKANNALANTTGTFAGDLTITGNVLTQGTIDFNNSTFNPNIAFVQITGSNNGTTIAPSNTNYMLQITGKANSVTRLVLDSFGAATYPVVVGRMGRGSVDTPSATSNNDVIMRIVGNGYTGTQFPASSPTKIDFIASENFSDTNRGTRIEFYNTPTGSNTIQRIASFNADTVNFTGTVAPQKGFVYTANVYSGNQTAITIDVANTSVTKANTTAGLVVTLSNLLAGKETILWVVNAAGTNQTFTHGVSALNSTVNSTTYNIPGTSSIMARYYCIDNTLANTFCAIVHT
jgi:hypothetical protein